MKITILGTSSATPTFKRALSGTLVDREAETFLFDCGEATQFRFMRAGARRGKLTRIFITHLHGDHYYGLPGLLSSLNLNQREAPLHVHGPVGLERYLNFIRNFPHRQRYTFDLHVHEIEPGFEGVVAEHREYVVKTLPLDHRVTTHGYRLEERPRPGFFDAEIADSLGVPFGPERGQLQRGENVILDDGTVVTPDQVVGPSRPGRVFAYCTDTKFCLNAKRLAQDADLLLHEATYGDDKLQLAIERKHSTIRQAATIAAAANVRQFVATHFSTRYSKELIDDLEREGREVYPDLIMARDLMTIEV